MTIRDALTDALHLPADSDAAAWLSSRGLAVANEDTMSRAIHDVYCGITADHDHPNAKDHEQAQLLLERIRRYATLGE